MCFLRQLFKALLVEDILGYIQGYSGLWFAWFAWFAVLGSIFALSSSDVAIYISLSLPAAQLRQSHSILFYQEEVGKKEKKERERDQKWQATQIHSAQIVF